MELDELRADFVEQIMQLRRKVINRVKPKIINGKKLSGAMLATLSQSYVTAINNGAVPNIENAWNYICKNECNKAKEDALTQFEETMKEEVMNRIPMEEDDLREAYQQAKKDSVAFFKKKAVGNVADEYIVELKQKIQIVFNQIKEENERVSAEHCINFLQSSYSFIERKLKNKEFQNGFYEYEEDLK
jgi:succinate dehydrogenase/fumarate reductase flavoprotein subunit